MYTLYAAARAACAGSVPCAMQRTPKQQPSNQGLPLDFLPGPRVPRPSKYCTLPASRRSKGPNPAHLSASTANVWCDASYRYRLMRPRVGIGLARSAAARPQLPLAHRGLSSVAPSTAPGFEVLHRSRLPTYHFQQSLPKLPVPKLDDTLHRMMYAAQPITTKAEFEELCKLAADFGAGLGPALQEALLKRDAAKYSSFITEPWFEMYLADRRPLLLNSNPQLTFKDEEDPTRATQAGRAARMCHAAMTFMRTLEAQVLEPDIFHMSPQRSKTALFQEAVRLLPSGVAFYGAAACGAFPLDMSQYANLFKSTRIPGAVRDELRTVQHASHVVVQRRGRFWKLDLLDKAGATVPLAQIEAALQVI